MCVSVCVYVFCLCVIIVFLLIVVFIYSALYLQECLINLFVAVLFLFSYYVDCLNAAMMPQ